MKRGGDGALNIGNKAAAEGMGNLSRKQSMVGEGSCEKGGGDSKRRTSSLQLVKELA
jgi:hypothetical protein